MLSKKVIEKCVKVQGYTLPWYYGISYYDFARATETHYIIPINYIVRYWRKIRWGFLETFYWVGLIDYKMGEYFTWDAFWRIKSH